MDNRDIFGRIPRKDSAINIEAEESRIEELKELAKHDPLKDEIAKRMGGFDYAGHRQADDTRKQALVIDVSLPGSSR